VTYHWSTHQLTEFFAAVGSLPDEAATVAVAVERTTEALEAEVGAFVAADGEVVSLGLGAGPPPPALRAVRPGQDVLELPRLGDVHLAVEALGEGGELLVAGRIDDPFSAEERQMFRGMAQVLGLTLRNLRTLAAERKLREEREREAARRLGLVRDLRTRERLLETLLAIQRAIFTRRPLQEVLDAITDGASAVLGGAGVALVLGENGGLQVPSTVGLPGGPENAHLAVAALAMSADTASVEGLVVAAPVHVSGTIGGSLVADLGLADAGPDAASLERRQDLLAAFAHQVSLAVTDARTVEAVHEAHHDSVTGLPNRALFLDRLGHALTFARRRGTDVAVLFIDLDRFKAVNDTLGHGAGDELLATVAERLRSRLRECDTAGRLGGDEFAVLLEDATTAGATTVAQLVIRDLNRPFRLAEREVSISASIGLVCTAEFAGSAGELVGAADVAMYEAKKGGAGRVVGYAPRMHAAVKERLDLEADLRRALGDGQLSLHYQPIVRLADRQAVGWEALLRWAHPERGPVPPGVFIPAAEDTGLIDDIGRWVLHQATRQVADPGGPGGMTLSVNVSGRQIMDPRLVEDVAAALAGTGLPAAALTLELTETVLARDPELALRQLHLLKELGVRLSIDDFGTGYSSLSYLRNLPVDQLKIDRSFVSGLDAVAGRAASTEDAAIVRAIIQLGRSLELEVVAEGIETEAQLAALVALGCPYGQGYLLGRPAAPLPETEEAHPTNQPYVSP
jgi:diguanylate cyclase (GGDEF)-like protein